VLGQRDRASVAGTQPPAESRISRGEGRGLSGGGGTIGLVQASRAGGPGWAGWGAAFHSTSGRRAGSPKPACVLVPGLRSRCLSTFSAARRSRDPLQLRQWLPTCREPRQAPARSVAPFSMRQVGQLIRHRPPPIRQEGRPASGRREDHVGTILGNRRTVSTCGDARSAARRSRSVLRLYAIHLGRSAPRRGVGGCR